MLSSTTKKKKNKKISLDMLHMDRNTFTPHGARYFLYCGYYMELDTNEACKHWQP